jgi:hypothetical protein
MLPGGRDAIDYIKGNLPTPLILTANPVIFQQRSHQLQKSGWRREE